MMDDFICSKELAERLRVTTMTIRNLRVRGLPHIRVGNRIRYNVVEVMQWLASEQQKNYIGAAKKIDRNNQ